MPQSRGLPPGTLVMLILQVVRHQPLHGYAIAQRIRQLSSDALSVEEGSLYPALQRALAQGWLKAEWITSESGRDVRSYRLTPKGLRQLDAERDEYRRRADGIAAILDSGRP
jgi:transcriptional regulator